MIWLFLATAMLFCYSTMDRDERERKWQIQVDLARSWAKRNRREGAQAAANPVISKRQEIALQFAGALLLAGFVFLIMIIFNLGL